MEYDRSSEDSRVRSTDIDEDTRRWSLPRRRPVDPSRRVSPESKIAFVTVEKVWKIHLSAHETEVFDSRRFIFLVSTTVFAETRYSTSNRTVTK